MKIKKDDKVVVLSGKDKGKQGKVLIADPKGGKVVVEGVNVAASRAKRAVLSRLRPRFTHLRSSLSAPSAEKAHALASR